MQFTTINHIKRKELWLSMNEYAIADTIYYISHSNRFTGSINKTYLSDFFWITRKNILLIINRLIIKWILDEDGDKTTELWELCYRENILEWVDLTQWVETTQLVSRNDTAEWVETTHNNNIININNNTLSSPKTNKKKKEKIKTDLNDVSTEQIIDWRNNLPVKYSLIPFIWKKGLKSWDSLNELWFAERNKYDKETFNRAIMNYFADINRRDQRNDYASHRFSLYAWIKQTNALLKFSSL